jgi:L-fucose mutarotase
MMLRGIDPLLSPDLLWVLASMGHGDDIAIVDANHPAERIARATRSGQLVRLPGIAIERAIAAVLSVLPLDDFEPDSVRRMLVVHDPAEIPAVQRDVQAVVDRAMGAQRPMIGIERFAFYECAAKAFAVVQCGDPRPYGCFLMRKGVIPGERP